MLPMRLFSLFIVMAFLSPAFASTYFLREGGTASNKSAAKGPCKTASATMSMATHNAQSFSPGDTIIVCDDGGSFSSTDFIPPSSGSEGNRIVYQAETGQGPIFEGRTYGIALDKGQDSLKFMGLTFQNTRSRWVEIGWHFENGRAPYNNHYIWFDHCTFYNAQAYSGILIMDGNYGRISNCTFPDAPPLSGITAAWTNACIDAYNAGGVNFPDYCDSDTAPADLIQSWYTGHAKGVSHSSHWIIEGNTFGRSSHDSFSVRTMNKAVVRNNFVSNTYHTGAAPGNFMPPELDPDRLHRPRILYEKNITVNAGLDASTSPKRSNRVQFGGVNLYTYGNFVIVRYNQAIGSQRGHMLMASSSRTTDSQRIYHNSIVNNYVGVQQTGNSSTAINDNEWKNNIVAWDSNYIFRPVGHYQKGDATIPYFWYNTADCSLQNCGTASMNLVNNNMFWPSGTNGYYFKSTSTNNITLEKLKTTYPTEWFASNFEGDPGFTSTHPVNFNLQLNSNSAARAAGAFLTKVTAINNNVITVEDANYFYDGWGIPGEVGDTIFSQAGSSAKILFIDYDTRQITLNAASNFRSGDQITTVKFLGSAPDIGAYQFGLGLPGDNQTNPPSPPKNLVIFQ